MVVRLNFISFAVFTASFLGCVVSTTLFNENFSFCFCSRADGHPLSQQAVAASMLTAHSLPLQSSGWDEPRASPVAFFKFSEGHGDGLLDFTAAKLIISRSHPVNCLTKSNWACWAHKHNALASNSCDEFPA